MSASSDEAALAEWLAGMQGTAVGLDGIINPSRGGKNVGALLDEAGADLVFEREPAEFYNLLLELAPKDLRRD